MIHIHVSNIIGFCFHSFVHPFRLQVYRSGEYHRISPSTDNQHFPQQKKQTGAMNAERFFLVGQIFFTYKVVKVDGST